MLTDDKLAAIAEETFWANDDGDDEQAAAENWRNVARAVRAALLPDVAPLGPGETVTIPTGYRDDGFGLWVSRTRDGDAMVVATTSWDDEEARDLEDDARTLDAAGVAALIETCRRWLAAQEGDK